MLFLATAAAAVMGGDPAREAEEYCMQARKYFLNADYSEAFKCYQRAAALGSAKALCEIGVFYNEGWVVEKNSELAQKYFTAAEPELLKLAEQDEALAQLAVAFFGPGNRRNDYWLKRAVNNFRAAAARGDAEAQIQLGAFYEHGEGVKKDLSEALKWYRKAAEQGHPEAAYFVGVFYLCGDGVKKNRAEAVKWFFLAAERGDTMSEFLIGKYYEFGKKDLSEAMKWYRRAARHGNKHAEKLLRKRNIPLEEPKKSDVTNSPCHP